MTAHTLYTIGYQGKDLNEFIAALERSGVTRVVDVREYAWSRKRGFSKVQLATALSAHGLAYTHLPRLGSPKPIRDKLRAGGELPEFFAAYRQYLTEQGDTLDLAGRLAATEAVALLCFEHSAAECHRSVVAETLADRTGLRVEHI